MFKFFKVDTILPIIMGMKKVIFKKLDKGEIIRDKSLKLALKELNAALYYFFLWFKEIWFGYELMFFTT